MQKSFHTYLPTDAAVIMNHDIFNIVSTLLSWSEGMAALVANQYFHAVNKKDFHCCSSVEHIAHLMSTHSSKEINEILC